MPIYWGMSEQPDPWTTPPKPRRRLSPYWLFLGAIAILLGLLVWRFPFALEEKGAWAHLVYMLCFLVLVAGGVFHKGIRATQILKYACIWIGTAGIAGLGYAYRFELGAVKDRMIGELVPGAGIPAAGGEILFRADSSGHYTVEAEINGVPVRFLVDTGASDVTLALHDAKRIGLDTGRLSFNRPYRTANGIVMGAPVTLPAIRVGPIEVRDVPASVNGAPLDASLLGMSFLERLSGYRVENGTLILRQ